MNPKNKFIELENFLIQKIDEYVGDCDLNEDSILWAYLAQMCPVEWQMYTILEKRLNAKVNKEE